MLRPESQASASPPHPAPEFPHQRQRAAPAGRTELRHFVLLETKVTDAGLAHVKKCTKLESLNIHRLKIGNAGLAHLKDLTQMEVLVAGSTGGEITDADLAHLARMNQLRTLDLSGNKITDVGLAHLKTFNGLRVLELSGTKITDAGLVWRSRSGLLNKQRVARVGHIGEWR